MIDNIYNKAHRYFRKSKIEITVWGSQKEKLKKIKSTIGFGVFAKNHSYYYYHFPDEINVLVVFDIASTKIQIQKLSTYLKFIVFLPYDLVQ
jgi:hypothetical protein